MFCKVLTVNVCNFSLFHTVYNSRSLLVMCGKSNHVLPESAPRFTAVLLTSITSARAARRHFSHVSYASSSLVVVTDDVIGSLDADVKRQVLDRAAQPLN